MRNPDAILAPSYVVPGTEEDTEEQDDEGEGMVNNVPTRIASRQTKQSSKSAKE